jgi:hypothetical protein
MTMQIIPCDPVAPFWTQTTTLDGVPYLLTFRYNSREQVYYLCIDSADGKTNYVQGVKLVCNFLLLTAYGNVPPGELMVLTSASGNDAPPNIGDLADNGRCTLVYVPEADLFGPGGTIDLTRFSGFIV